MALCFRSLQALNTADYERWLSALLPFCTNPLRHSGSMSEACLAAVADGGAEELGGGGGGSGGDDDGAAPSF